MAVGDPVSSAIVRAGSSKWLTAVAFAGLAVTLFAAAMTSALDYDEEQYVAGAYFARDLAVYRDFISLQPPPYTWLMSRVFEISDGWYLLTARIVTWSFAVASCWLLYRLLRSLSCTRIIALLLVGAFASSPFLEGPLVETRNDIQPLFLMLAGLRLFLGRDGAVASGRYRLGASGLLLSVAAATKYSYVFAAPLAAAALVYDAHRHRAGFWLADARLRWFAAGAFVGVLPVLHALYVQCDRFLFMTLRFHGDATPDWYQGHGQGEMLTLRYELGQLAQRLVQQGNGMLAILLGAASIALALRKPRATLRTMANEPIDLALGGLLIGALVIALVVGPHAMYYAPVAALLTLITGRLLMLARPRIAQRLFALLLVVSALPALTAVGHYADALRRSQYVGQWVGVQAHRSARRISGLLAERAIDGDVATLFPSVVIDTNRVRREFATGPFFFRSAYLYSPDEIARLHGVGPDSLDSPFASAPPAAIVAGFRDFELFNGMDAALLDYAHRAGYTLVIERLTVRGYQDGQVWVRSAPSASR